MNTVTIHSEAEVELLDAVSYYEEKNPGLGIDFITEVENAINYIRNFPKSFPLREDGTRRSLIQRFPYIVIYTYQKNHIWIIAFAHCKRKPDYWSDRFDE